jgi:hypothetical protein
MSNAEEPATTPCAVTKKCKDPDLGMARATGSRKNPKLLRLR